MPIIEGAKPCPYCRSRHQSYFYGYDSQHEVSVQCVCGAQGPTRHNDQLALESWNNRP